MGCWPVTVPVPNASPAVQGRGRRGHACASSRCRRRARARTAGTRIRRRSYRRGSKRRGRRPYPRRRRRPARTDSRGSEGRRWPLGLPVAGTERRRLLHGRQPLPLAWLHLGMLGCIHRSGAEDRDFRDHLAGAGGRQHQLYGRRHPTWGHLAGTAIAGSRARLMVEGRMPHGTGPRQGRGRICGFDAGCPSAGRTRWARLFYGVTLRARVLILPRPAAGSVKFEGALYDRSNSS